MPKLIRANRRSGLALRLDIIDRDPQLRIPIQVMLAPILIASARSVRVDNVNLDAATQAGVLTTPHIGGSTEEAQEIVGVRITEQVVEYLTHGVAINAVTMPRLSPDQYLARVRMRRLRIGWEPSFLDGERESV